MVAALRRCSSGLITATVMAPELRESVSGIWIAVDMADLLLLVAFCTL
jgi:hypothetical protein